MNLISYSLTYLISYIYLMLYRLILNILQDHMNCHTGNRPYQCQMCHKSFRQRSVYHKHLEIHNNVKFMCAFCGLIFASKKAVFEHKEMVGSYCYCPILVIHSKPQLSCSSIKQLVEPTFH